MFNAYTGGIMRNNRRFFVTFTSEKLNQFNVKNTSKWRQSYINQTSKLRQNYLKMTSKLHQIMTSKLRQNYIKRIIWFYKKTGNFSGYFFDDIKIISKLHQTYKKSQIKITSNNIKLTSMTMLSRFSCVWKPAQNDDYLC